MSEGYRKGPHTIYDIQYHIVSVTKYRYHALKGDLTLRSRDIIRQTCEERNVSILNRHVSKDHVHIHVSNLSELSPSKLVQYVKDRSSRLIKQEFPHLRKRYWGKHIWARGNFWATIGKVTEKIPVYIVQQEKARPKDVFTVANELPVSAE